MNKKANLSHFKRNNKEQIVFKHAWIQEFGFFYDELSKLHEPYTRSRITFIEKKKNNNNK